MLRKPWVQWLLVFVGVLVISAATWLTLIYRELFAAARGVQIAGLVLASLWSYYGLYRSREHMWARAGTTYLALTHLTWLTTWGLFAAGRETWGINLLGVWTLAVVGMLGIRAARILLSLTHPVAAIARSAIDQAFRMHLVTVTIFILALVLVLLPRAFDAEERLNYRVTNYLKYSMGIGVFLTSVLTVVLACWSVCSDIANRQMHMIATKPVGRFQYILGKWLGYAALNLVLVAMMGVGVYTGAVVLANEPLPDPVTPEAQLNREMALSEVLVARVEASPQLPPGMDLRGMVEAQFEQVRAQYGGAVEKLEDLPQKDLNELRGKALAAWHAIAPGRSSLFMFVGLDEFARQYKTFLTAREELVKQINDLREQGRGSEAEPLIEKLNAMTEPVSPLKLRLKPKYGSPPQDNLVRMVLEIAGSRVALAPMPDNTSRDIPIPLRLVTEDGRLVIRIWNVNAANPQATHADAFKFTPDEGLVLSYTIGSFDANLARALAIHWIRLVFLGMLSVMAGTFLGFPVASLLSLSVYIAASLSAYLAESVDFYSGLDVKNKSKWDVIVSIFATLWTSLTEADFGKMVKLFITLVGKGAVAIVPSFSEFNPTPLLADGQYVAPQSVLDAALILGVAYTGMCAAIAWLSFRRKELARVTV